MSMRNQQSARWGMGLALLAITVVVLWQWRTSVRPPALVKMEQAAKSQSPAPVESGPLLSVAPATSLRSVDTNLPALPPDPEFPYRLRNTEEKLGKLARNDRAILMANALIDTGMKARLGVPSHLQAKTDPGSYIVQSRGKINDSFRAQLKSVGAEVIAYIPNNAYLVRVNAEGAKQLSHLSWTRAVLPYEPYYKLQENLLPYAVQEAPVPLSSKLRLTFFPGELDNGRAKVEQLGAKILGEDRSPFGPQLIVQPQKDSLVALAGLTEVQTVERQGERVAMNDLTRNLVGISSNTFTPNNYRDLTGTNVLVGMADSGVDTNYLGLYGRVMLGLLAATNDTRGHGTHVASTLAGSGIPGPSFTTNFMGSYPSNDFRGMAPQAKILFHDYRTLSDANLAEYAARTNLLLNLKTNTMIVNNSWGYNDSYTYDSSSAIYDAATRDAIPAVAGSQQMLFIFAAGNDGFGGNNGLGGLPNSVSSLAAAKNVIAVGASELLRYITNEVTIVDSTGQTNIIPWWEGTTDSSNEVAAYSGRGNTGIGREGDFGRAKPDVVAPGSMVISGRSPSWDETNYYSASIAVVNTFTNITLAAGSTNSFSLFLPNGTTNLMIEVLDTGSGVTPVPDIDIYTNQTSIQPSSSAANLYGATPLNIPIDTNSTGIWFYDLVNTNTNFVSVNVRETYLVTNNLGDYFDVLRYQLNGPDTNGNPILDPYYRFEVGTSMAAPVVSGMLALMQEFFERDLGETNNSPALYKAMVINSARTLSQTYGHETKSLINYQGWGLVNISNALPVVMSTNTPRTEWPLQYFDQSPTNALATGQTHSRDLTVAPIAKPFPLRITLVWTDPPGNPAASLKLVNDLDLVVSNRVTGELFYGNDFPSGSIYSVGNSSSTNAVADFVNNVENVYLPGDLSDDYTIYVVGNRVNVNAVTAHTNGIVQDYALVVSSGNVLLTSPFALDQTPTLHENYQPKIQYFTSSTNSLPFIGQRVGANAPLITTTNGNNVQWNFYVFTNDTTFPYVTFVSFLSPNLSGDPRINTYRDPGADIDLYVSTDTNLINLNASVINDCFANTIYGSPTSGGAVSITRGGSEYILIENSPPGQVYYIGIKAEDQKGAEFGFLAVATEDPPFEDNMDGSYDVNFIPIPAPIPDGNPEKPEGVQLFGIFPQSVNIHRVIARNTMTHDLFGDLVGTLEHNNEVVTLNNHTFISSTNQGGTVSIVYDDSDEADIPGSVFSDGPGNLNRFVGTDASGVWIFTMVDNAPQFVGQVDSFSLTIEKEEDIFDLGGGGLAFGLAPGRSYYAGFTVPPGVVQIKFTLGSTPTVFSGLYIKRRGLPNGILGDYDYGKEANTQFELSVSTADIPPLRPGRYFLQVMNRGAVYADYNLTAELTYDLAATAQNTTAQRGLATVRDDAQTSTNLAEINVTSAGDVAGVRVGVRIAHPRPSDLILRLTNPYRSVLLSENRGGTVNTNGYGMGTNANEIIYTHFSEDTSIATKPIKFADPAVEKAFVPFVTPSLVAENYLEDTPSSLITTVSGGTGDQAGRLIDTTQTAGQIRIRYNFYSIADDLIIYDSSGTAVPGSSLVSASNPFITLDDTMVDAASDTITVAHSYVDGDEVSFTGSNLPGGLSPQVRYFIVNSVASTSFQLALTAGGTAIDITTTGTGTFNLFQWLTLGPLNYTSPDGVLYIVMNEGSGSSSTGYDYVIELFDTGGTPITTTALPVANQIAYGVKYSGTNLYLVGSTEANVNNAIYGRFGLPMQAGQIPYETVNWPDNAGGANFRGVAVGASGSIYAAGDSFTRTTDGTGTKQTKGIVVRFPRTGLANLGDSLGSSWDTPIAGVTGVEGTEELYAVLSTVESGNEYVYATGNAEDGTSTSRLKVVKLDDTGATAATAFEDVSGGTTVSAGRALAALNDNIFVAGFSDDSGTMNPEIFKFDSALNEIDRQPLGITGQFYGLVAYDGFLYAVGVQDAVSGGLANFLVVKYDQNLNVIWSTVGDANYDLGAEDILYGLTAAGDRLYAVGSTDNGAAGLDGVLLEIDLETGNLITRPATGYLGVTVYDGGASATDSFRDVVMEGSDLYVVGETTRLTGPTPSPARTDTDALVLRYHVKDDYQPEESLDNFVGDVAAGTWRLEVIDARTNYTVVPNYTPIIVDWELKLFLADTNVSTFRLDNGIDFLGTIAGGTVQYFVINAPMTASSADHTLTVTSGAGTGLSLFYDPSAPPSALSGTALLNNVTTSLPKTLNLTSSPLLVPGQRYFLAVSNSNPSTVVSEYTLNVTFDSSATTYLASGATQGGNFASSPSIYQAYQFVIPAADNYATFELLNLTGDVKVRLRRGQPVQEGAYDVEAVFTGVDRGIIPLEPTVAMPNVSGFWYALVESLSGPDTSYQVRIRPINKAPVLAPIPSGSVLEGNLFSVQASATDVDQPANVLTYSFSSAVPTGMTIDSVTGAISWVPTEAQGPGIYDITVRVTDDGYPVFYAEQSFQVSVLEVNTAPTLAAATFFTSEGASFAPVIQASDSDLPANTLTFSLVSGPAGMTINSNSGQINWTPDESMGGQSVSFTVRVSDGVAAVSRAYSVQVSESNSAPVFGNIPAQSVNELSPLVLTVQATDADTPANTLVYKLVGDVPSGLQIDTTTGQITWTPTEAQGPGNYEVTVEAKDNGVPSLTAQKTISISVLEVNEAPTITSIPAQTAVELALWSYQVQASDVDLPANTLTYSLPTKPTGMTISVTGLIEWTPTENQGPGTYAVTVVVTDNGSPARGASRSFNITVNEANTPPTLNAVADVSVDEQTSLALQAVGADSDVPAQTLTYRFTGTVPAGLTIHANTGAISWSPSEAQGPASYPVTVEVSDGVATASRSFTITVNEVNLAPTLGIVPNVTVTEGQTVRFVVTGSDADVPAQTLTYSLDAGAPAGATINGSTGAFEWATTEDSPNNNSLTVRVTDNGVPPLSATRTFTITVNEVVTNVVDLVSSVAVTNTTRYADSIVADIYRLNVSSEPAKLLFEAFNLSGNGDLLVRRGAHPTLTEFDYSSVLTGTSREQVVVVTNETLLNLTGEWFATVVNRESTNIVYSISGTIPVTVSGGAILVSTEGIMVETPTFNTGNGTPEFSWTTVQGEQYQVEVSTDLINWTPLTSVVVNGTTATFTDPTPYTDSLQRFYRIRQLPQ